MSPTEQNKIAARACLSVSKERPSARAWLCKGEILVDRTLTESSSGVVRGHSLWIGIRFWALAQTHPDSTGS